ncbi:serotype-specific antigen 1 [Trichinella spiralis]|uniref:serotype-specific antigen 1 n=1 Tax=Trichinella spiralis TaxID=6334 RepID=UPI0001EFC343|nr:serotype-specific antigen 1 [Trichinella spiralis]XP_003381593.1 serotype-specific antigen 1 [Trichinella spiralis]
MAKWTRYQVWPERLVSSDTYCVTSRRLWCLVDPGEVQLNLSQVQRRYQLRKGFVQGDFECFFYFPELSKNFTTGFLLSRQQRSGLFSHHHGCQNNWNPTDLDCKATGPSVEGDRR